MMKYLKSLNWKGFLIVLIISMMAALSRKQDDSIISSIIIGLVGGTIFGLFFLIAGRNE